MIHIELIVDAFGEVLCHVSFAPPDINAGARPTRILFGSIGLLIFRRGRDGLDDIQVEAVGVLEAEVALAPVFGAQGQDDVQGLPAGLGIGRIDIFDLQTENHPPAVVGRMEDFRLSGLGRKHETELDPGIGDKVQIPLVFKGDPKA